MMRHPRPIGVSDAMLCFLSLSSPLQCTNYSHCLPLSVLYSSLSCFCHKRRRHTCCL